MKELDKKLINAVDIQDVEAVKMLLDEGANPNTRDTGSGLTVLMIAAGRGNPKLVRLLIDKGADVFACDSKAGATALHKACQGGSLEVVKILVDNGAFINAVVVSTGHTALIEALWFKQADICKYLIEQNAGINLSTHYGFTILQHFEYAMNVNQVGREKLLEADKALKSRQSHDAGMVETQKLMKAVVENNLKEVQALISAGAEIDERSPVLNGFNDYHTPLLVACRDGHTEIVKELINAGADINAVEPTFGAVPLHKATYNGRADITQILVEQVGINLDYQGPTNGYAPLHDALWHGFADCSVILIKAGASLVLKGHDGKTPLQIATEMFGEGHEIVELIREKSTN